MYKVQGWGEFFSRLNNWDSSGNDRIYGNMEQDDLEKFRYWESDGIGYLDCYHCNLNSGRTISNSDLETMGRPNLLELMEDAAAHFAEVHRKSNG